MERAKVFKIYPAKTETSRSRKCCIMWVYQRETDIFSADRPEPVCLPHNQS